MPELEPVSKKVKQKRKLKKALKHKEKSKRCKIITQKKTEDQKKN